MSKLSIICLSILAITIVMSNLSVESNRNDSAEHRIQKRVVGGLPTEKYQDTVFRLDWNSNSCTGTFIAPNAILTAAQCCENAKSSNLKIYNPHHQFIYVTVPLYHLHPSYNNSGASNYDIAIIELAENITDINEYASWIVPAELDFSGVKCGDTVWMYGYGRTDYLIRAKQTYIQTDRVNELSSEVVECSWYNRITPDEDMIFTYGKNGTMCFGDAGGPMFNQNGEIVGVHSGGGENCSTSELNYAVRISSHKDFIQAVLQQNSTSTILDLEPLIFSIL